MNHKELFAPSELSSESYKELLPYFFEELKEDFLLITKAFEDKNFIEIKRLAHKIKGCASSYSATFIAENAWQLENTLIINSTNNLEHRIDALNEAIDLSFNFAKKQFKL